MPDPETRFSWLFGLAGTHCKRRTRIASREACAWSGESFTWWFCWSGENQVCPLARLKWVEMPQIHFSTWAMTPTSFSWFLVCKRRKAGYTGTLSDIAIFLVVDSGATSIDAELIVQLGRESFWGCPGSRAVVSEWNMLRAVQILLGESSTNRPIVKDVITAN